MAKEKTITVDGIEYVPKGAIQAKKVNNMKYVICRTYSAGVFAGYLKSKQDQNVILLKARRLWYWAGAASLSQLAMEGTTKPESCKFPCEVDQVELDQVIEVLDVTEKAQQSINSISIWRQ